MGLCEVCNETLVCSSACAKDSENWTYEFEVSAKGNRTGVKLDKIVLCLCVRLCIVE